MTKDWTGNKKSVFATMGASNHSKEDRETHDFYASSPVAIDKLVTKFDIPHKVWECACGMGHLSERLKELGHDVYSSDLIDRGYGDVIDFLSWDADAHKEEFECIITNPPYSRVTEFVLKAFDLLPDGGKAVFLLKTTALESRSRFEKIYRFTPPTMFSSSSTGFCAQRTEISSMRKRISEQGRRRMLGSFLRKVTKVRQC